MKVEAEGINSQSIPFGVTAEDYQRQLDLESEMRCLGIKRERDAILEAKQRGEESSTRYGVLMTKMAIEPLAEAFEKFIAEAKSGRAGRKHAAVKALVDMNPEVFALITAKRCLDGITAAASLATVAVGVGAMLEDECLFRAMKDKNKKLWDWTAEKTTKNAQHRRRVLVWTSNRHTDFDHWPNSKRLLVGMKAVELFVQSTGFADVETRQEGVRSRKTYIVATQHALDIITREEAREHLLTPVFMPTIIPPRRWKGILKGGYYFTRQLPLVKVRNKNYIEDMKGAIMPNVYEAVNTVQATPWCVNAKLYQVMADVWAQRLTLGELPQQEDLSIPPSPIARDADPKKLPPAQQEAFKQWKMRAADIHIANVKTRSKRLQAMKIMATAKRFLGEKAIYFPHQLDFRGRMYCIPMFLHPQGNDMARALLLFAEGKPIMDHVAAGWLAIHGANLYGEDKVTFEDRIEWVKQNEDDIIRVASDPLAHRMWEQADKPWQFLAWCFEWAAFQAQGFGYVSSMPIALDGSCNGLQHYSAALRDEVGGAAVNLVPSDKPSDIYQIVADKLVERLEGIDGTEPGENDCTYAAAWLAFGITRKTTKRVVMTLPYGATMFSAKDYVAEYMAEREKEAEAIFGDKKARRVACAWLAKHMWKVIGETVVAARAGMDWLQKCAKVCTKAGMPIVWTTPVGFVVRQSYPELKSRRVETMFGDRLIKPTITDEIDGTLDKNRQVNGIAPNWVHSRDAAHLMVTVCVAKDNGIRSFAMIHDSYGTVAADTELLSRCLRETFVHIYDGTNALDDFRQEVVALVGEADVPPAPNFGKLNVAEVRGSDFFFA
jgi:DNA-directed RNA polymerase